MNDPWLEIWQECRRIVTRSRWRAETWILHRQLWRAECILGELGWQQADFHPGDNVARELESSEKEQARLFYEIAERRETISQLETTCSEKSVLLRQQIDEAELTRERAEAHAIHLQTALAAEKERHTALYLIENLEKSLAQEEARLRAAAQLRQPLRDALASHEKTALQEMAIHQKALKQLETRLSHLQQKKPNHFAEIGRELADAGIAPLNQPETLTRVLILRDRLNDSYQSITDSLASSRLLTRHVRIVAYALALLIAFTIGLFLFLISSITFSLLRR